MCLGQDRIVRLALNWVPAKRSKAATEIGLRVPLYDFSLQVATMKKSFAVSKQDSDRSKSRNHF